MVNLGKTFDASQYEDATPFDVLPAGQYTAMITHSEEKTSRAGDAYIRVEFTIDGGHFSGRKLWENLNLYHSNPEAARIANSRLSSIVKACGLVTAQDTEELHTIPMTIKVRVKSGKDQHGNLRDENQIVAFAPLGGAPTATPPKPAARPVAGAAPKTAPWKRS